MIKTNTLKPNPKNQKENEMVKIIYSKLVAFLNDDNIKLNKSDDNFINKMVYANKGFGEDITDILRPNEIKRISKIMKGAK